MSSTLSEGYDFLGFNVRRYGNKLLIKPSKAAVRRIRERLRDELRSLRGSNAPAVIKRLNPIIRGWAAYYRTQVSAEIFGKLDHYLWRLTYKWATLQPREQADDAGSLPGTSASSTRPGKTGGCSATAPAAPSCTASPGPTSSATRSSDTGRHPMTPSWPTTGPGDGAKHPCRSTTPPCRLHREQDGRCAICKSTLLAVEDRPQTPQRMGNTGWRPPARRSTSSGTSAHGQG